ncbi:ABC transporter ATP-binding protein [Candidatus Saccharibacteria bacterium]|nr:ABC transporter ATP-binding protein [Candidatus Saccharibacteria bacterium]
MSRSKAEKEQHKRIRAEAKETLANIHGSKKSKKHNKDNPRISFKSIFYVMKVYRRAVGPKRYFLIAYRIYSAVLPSVTAILAGRGVTQLASGIPTRDFMPAFTTIMILLGVQLVDMLMREISSIINASTFQEVYAVVSEEIALKYIEIPLADRESRVFADKFDRVREFGSSLSSVANSLIGVATSFLRLASAVIAMLTVSPIVTILVIVTAVPYSIINFRLAAKQQKNWRKYTKDRRIAYAIENKITNSNSALEIEINDLQRNLVDRMVKSRRRSQEQDIADRRAFFWPNVSSDALENIVNYSILAFIAKQIIDGKLDIGQFLTVRNLLSQLNTSIIGLFYDITSINADLVNATDYMEFMQTPARPNGDTLIKDIPKIEFRDVCFTYPNADRPALNHVSFTLEPGDSVAIVGENGAGKTTLIKLLIGAYTPTSGLILVNDRPISEIHRESYLAQIGALFQDYTRFEFATLGENVWFGDVSKRYREADIMAALDDAGLAELPSHYKDGLKQILSKNLSDDKTAELSGGQWQRIGIARAFYRSPGVLILDEPTSAVDAKSEYEIFRNIIAKQSGRTTIIISHRFSTVRKARRIIVLSHGEIVESGTHEELMAHANGLYKEMFELQAEGYN